MFEEKKPTIGGSAGENTEGVSVGSIRPENVLEFPSDFGVTFFITKSATDTAGEYLEFSIIQAHRGGPPVHIHPHQEEIFRVATGTLDVFLDGRWQQIHAGESVTFPQGASHTIKNEHDEYLQVHGVIRPALSFEDYIRTFHRLATSGKIKSLPPKDPSSLIYSAILFTEYEDTQVVIKPPAFVLKLLAFIGRRLGYKLD